MTQSPSHAPGFARTTFYSPLFVPFARVSLLSPTSPGSSHKFNAKVKTSTTRSRVGRDTRSLGEEVAVCVCACVCSCSLSDRMLICWYRSSIVVVIIVVSFHRVFTFTFLSRIARAFSTGFFADARYVPWFCTCTRSFVSRRATNLHYTTYGHVELRQVKNVCYDCVEYKASKKKWNIANKSKLM